MALTDTSPCPVSGKNFGRLMGNVSMSFLQWVCEQGWAPVKYPDVIEYVAAKEEAHARELQEAAEAAQSTGYQPDVLPEEE